MSDHREIERAYDVAPGQPLPALETLPGVARLGEAVGSQLQATYVDTADLALVRAGVTLRRRTGGSDEGWHLKVPAGSGRDEVHRPLGRTHDVPASLAAAVLGLTRGRPLVPVATIETVRTTILLLDPAGCALAEVADDSVIGTPGDGAATVSWRELEVELVEAPEAFLDGVERAFAAAGVHPRAEQRKVGTVLAHRLPPPAEAPRLSRKRTAGPVLHRRLREQVDAVVRRDLDVRRGVDDGVHRLRVACRRLRAALATYRPLVDRDVTDPVREELRWVARSLGAGRDAEVLHERLHDLVDELPRTAVIGAVRRRLDYEHARQRRAAGDVITEVLTSPRYLALLDSLESLAAAPPWTPRADASARRVLLPRVERDLRRLRARVRDAAVQQDVSPAAHDLALHEVRKAAKRLRYACEMLEPVWGRDATALRKAAQQVTQLLGSHQDGVVARTELRRIATAATADGRSAFTFGVMWAREEARADRLAVEFDRLWERMEDRSLRRWLH